jgi:hypothetical protein
MKPILLIHGYSSEGKSATAKEIYGSLPAELRKLFGSNVVNELNLSRWISLSDGVRIDDISYAMDRALKAGHSKLLDTGFHVIIHSTGALVVRNWIKNHSDTPCPIENLIHLAGANFGSGLAHIGQGQLSRWGRLIFAHTGRGTQVLDELEFGSWKTLDMHRHFLQRGKDMYKDYQVKEFCIIGSQIPKVLRVIPIRYIKEDSSDNTVRTSAGNLNFNYVPVTPTAGAFKLSVSKLNDLVMRRLDNETIKDENYEFDLDFLSQNRVEIPYAVAYETAHFGKKMGIVGGLDNRASVMPLIKKALETTDTTGDYVKTTDFFRSAMASTFKRIAERKYRKIGWNKHRQYEGHAQLIFRLRDQFGVGVKHFDITFKTLTKDKSRVNLESLIEDDHVNKKHDGTVTFYLRTQDFNNGSKTWSDLLERIAPVNVEITGHESESGEILYVPLNMRLSAAHVKAVVSSFKTTIIDVQLARLPSQHVFKISKS